MAKRLGPVAERCDIVIIDWQLFDDDGERTLALIKALCERDDGDRLRLMCVYSGEPEMAKISEKLREAINLETVDGNNCLLRRNHIIVTVLAKKAVPEDKIVDELIECFSSFTKGLLSNAVLAAMAGIRRSAHRVIKKFDADLDRPYISHRIMSVPVDNVEGEILSLIASELESIIHQSKAGAYIDSSAIKKWMDSDTGQGINKGELPCKEEDVVSILVKMIENGADKDLYDDPEKFKAPLQQGAEAPVCQGIKANRAAGEHRSPKSGSPVRHAFDPRDVL